MWFAPRTTSAVLKVVFLGAMLTVGMPIGCGTLPDSALLNNNLESNSPDNSTDAGLSVPQQDCLGLGQPSDDIHKAIFDNLNTFRQANGLPPLIYSETLETAADAHVRDLYERGYFAHINPDGQTPGQRAVAAGFCHEYVGENIAAGQKSADAAQTAWENSPSHHDNMLDPKYKYGGVGFYQDPKGRMYWGQEMAYDMPTGG